MQADLYSQWGRPRAYCGCFTPVLSKFSPGSSQRNPRKSKRYSKNSRSMRILLVNLQCSRGLQKRASCACLWGRIGAFLLFFPCLDSLKEPMITKWTMVSVLTFIKWKCGRITDIFHFHLESKMHSEDSGAESTLGKGSPITCMRKISWQIDWSS